MTKAKTKSVAVSKTDKRVLNSYINQAYLLKKYQTLKADTKDIVGGIFDRAKQNVIIIDDVSYVQKIERTQRRFDGTSFIEHVKKSKDKNLQLLINGFYKTIKTVEFKPFNDTFEQQRKELINAKR
jgi:hypothetical protein|tara:strand:- start:247 stop:624 length:378 start_codon:yes stop_codon:yes gene_type:complete